MFATKSLVIVDLQEPFLKGYQVCTKRLIASTQLLIKKAMKANSFIFLVEFEGQGKTISPISQLLSNYRYCRTIIKDEDGGGNLVHAEADEYLLPRELVVCGAYTYWCVLSTLEQLAHLGYSLSLAIDACLAGMSKRLKWQQKLRELPLEFTRSTRRGVFTLAHTYAIQGKPALGLA